MAGRHIRKAALPPAGFTRPISLDESGLRVTIYDENGQVQGVCDFTGLPGSVELRRAFAAALERKGGPGGTWRAYGSCDNGLRAIRDFLTWVNRQDDPPQNPAGITPATWTQWRISLPDNPTGRRHWRNMRILMPEVCGVPTETLKVADRRVTNAPPTNTPTSFSYAEYERIRAAAATVFNTALVRIRANREHLRRWYGGEFTEGTTQWLIGEALDSLVRTGDVPLREINSRRVSEPHRQALGSLRPEATWGRLYLGRGEAAAAAVLLVASEAWNKSVLDHMKIPDHDPAVADDFDIHMVEINKHRRPVRLRYTTNNLLDSGPDTPGRLMSRVIEATELARQTLHLQGQPTDRLLVWRRAAWRTASGEREWFATGVPPWGGSAHGRDEFDPNAVSLQRLRRTVQVLVRKEPAQNAQDTHDDVYVLGDPAGRAEAQDTVVQGLTDALDHARTIVKMRVVLGDGADHLIELSDDPEMAKAIAEGEYDTATGSCTDLNNSPFTEPGLPCTASFLLCLACGNAVATRRHLPRLTYLHETLQGLRTVLDPAVWDHDWREHLLRVDSLLDTHTTPAERVQERAKLGDFEKALVDRMLHRKLEAS